MSATQATHIIIPDTQVKPGVPLDHLRWIGEYLIDHFAGRPNVKLIMLGDHADMPSLSSYDKGKKGMEGRRVQADIKAANIGWALLNQALVDYNAQQKATKHAQWWPERHITLGNHEDRISRACEDDAQLDGFLNLDLLDYARSGWTVHPFLKPLELDGISYAHYFYNPMTGKPLGGAILNRLKTLGHSFTMGHQQLLDHQMRTVKNHAQHGLVAGACYLHDEEYKGYQGNAHWRGIVICHQVENGDYDLMTVRLDYLCRRYEGVSIEEFMARGKFITA